MRLDGKVAVVTGGSKGIGRAVAAALAAEGVSCMLAARSEADLAAAAGEVAAQNGSDVRFHAGDLRQPHACEALRAATLDAFGRADILVNAAGATKAGPFLELGDPDWEDGFALKLHAAVRLCRLFWPDLKDSRGAVINIIGGLARTPSPDMAIGGAVNAAFSNFTKALAGMGLRDDVNVNAIHPGLTRTQRHHRLMEARARAAGVTKEEFEREIVERQGIRRLGEPEDIAALAVFLCLPEARHIQGTAIAVDGGATNGLF